MAENVPSLGRDLDIQYHEDNRSLPNNLLQNTLYYNCLKPKTKREFLKQQEKKTSPIQKNAHKTDLSAETLQARKK